MVAARRGLCHHSGVMSVHPWSDSDEQRLLAQARTVLRSMPWRLIVLDDDGNITLVNDAWVRAMREGHGSEPAGRIGGNYLAICRQTTGPFASRAAEACAGIEAVLHGRLDHYTLEYPQRDGHGERWFSMSVTPLDGPGNGAVVAHLDISARKRADAALARSQASLAQAQRIANIGNWDLDLVNDELTWSDQIYRMFEIDPYDFDASYEAFLQTVHPEDRELVDKAYTASVKNRQPYHLVHRLLMSDGRVKYVQQRAETIYALDGTPLRSIGTVQDITEQQRAKERLHRAEAELHHAARLNTAGEMAAGLAHELNQPLTAIAHYCDAARSTLLARAERDAELLAILDDIEQQAQRAGGVIRGIRRFLRHDDATMNPVDLNELVESTLPLIGPELRTREVLLQTSLQVRLPRVRADWIQIQQVLINLVRNGIEAIESAPGGPRELCVATAAGEDGTVTLAVSDSGPGVDERVREALFKPFSTTKPNGMGLGLSISRSIVDAHGGRLWTEPAAGGGTVFRCALPADCRDGDGP